MEIIKNIHITNDIASKFTPFLVKCKTNSTNTHHLEHDNGKEFNLYAIIHSIEKKEVTVADIERFKEIEFNLSKKSKKNRRQYFDLNASIKFTSKINDNEYIEIDENFNSISSLARGMAIIVDCIKKNVLNELNFIFKYIKKEKIKNFLTPLNYLVNKGNFFDIGMEIKNKYTEDDLKSISIDNLIKIDNKKGINGWTYILYQTHDNDWISLNYLFTREIRAGKECLNDNKSMHPKIYNINENIKHLNKYEELKVIKIPFDNERNLNKKGRYSKLKLKEDKKRKRELCSKEEKEEFNIQQKKRKEYEMSAIKTLIQLNKYNNVVNNETDLFKEINDDFMNIYNIIDDIKKKINNIKNEYICKSQ